MGDNAALTEAKRAKKDEFYTQRVDIENELRHYRAHFIGKVVLCNCDDPRQSEFFKYFAENFAAQLRDLAGDELDVLESAENIDPFIV